MSTVLIQDDGAVRTLTLNRPERLNALNPELMDELTAALVEAQQAAQVRIVILRGAGDAFCSGLDIAVLREMGSMTLEQHRTEAERVARMFRALYHLDVPTIAVVQGPAIAGGTGLATICDYTLAAPEARFGYTEVRIGFIPALVSAYLTMQIGDKAARGLLLSARFFAAEEAYRLGLVNEVLLAAELDARAAALAAELQRNSPQSMCATKQLLRAQRAEWLEAALALAMDANTASRQTEDFREGVASFVEKRKPIWK